MIIVAKDGSGDYTFIQDAIHALEGNQSERKEIYIKKGIYKERLEIKTPYLFLRGEDAYETIITNDIGAFQLDEKCVKMGTFRTYTVLVDTHHVSIENLTIQNSAGQGVSVGQAIALYADGDQLNFHNIRLLGRQDTLFIGPLPPKEIEKNGFLGPKQFSPRINGRQYYEKCYIEGDVDFIFGSGTAFFEECQIHSLNLNKEINGYVTAASTPEGQEFGFVFNRCRFTSDCANESVYLGRPWRNFAKTIILESEIGAHILPVGWHNWKKEEAEKTVVYGEYGNFGEGGKTDHRIEWLTVLTQEDIHVYSKEKVLNS